MTERLPGVDIGTPAAESSPPPYLDHCVGCDALVDSRDLVDDAWCPDCAESDLNRGEVPL